MPHVRLFLSTVTAEFRSYREQLRRDLTRPNVSVMVQEDFIVTGTESLDMLDDYIRQCDVVIHIVGDMTGALAQAPSLAVIQQRYPNLGKKLPLLAPILQSNAPTLSYTQWEAWLALYHDKQLIIAVPQEDAPRDERYKRIPEQRAAQQEHLQRLAKMERHPFPFANADRLVVEVLRSEPHETRIQTESPDRADHIVTPMSRKEILGLATMGIGSVAFILSMFGHVGNETAKFILMLINVTFALVFWYGIRGENQKLELKDGLANCLQYVGELGIKVPPRGQKWEPMNVASTSLAVDLAAVDIATRREDRVNRLVKQFTENVKHLAESFVWLYAIIFLIDQPSIRTGLGLQGVESEILIFLKVAEGIANLAGAYFAVRAFLVLYNKTLESDGSEMKYYMPYLKAALLIAVMFIFATIGVARSTESTTSTLNKIGTTLNEVHDASGTSKDDLHVKCTVSPILGVIKDMHGAESTRTQEKADEVLRAIKSVVQMACSKLACNSDPSSSSEKDCSTRALEAMQKEVNNLPHNSTGHNLLQLLIGSLTGLSFSLLFSRYISMEHQLRKMSVTHHYYPEYFIGVFTVILPIYALVQPLFGVFDIGAFGPPAMFANGVFLFCLVGKGFFFYVTWHFLMNKLMHYHLHLVLSNHGVPEDLDKCFKP